MKMCPKKSNCLYNGKYKYMTLYHYLPLMINITQHCNQKDFSQQLNMTNYCRKEQHQSQMINLQEFFRTKQKQLWYQNIKKLKPPLHL